MIFREYLLSLVAIVGLLTIVTAQDQFTGCTPYDIVGWQNISRDPASLDDPDGRPLGFIQTVLPYHGNNPNAKDPCFTVQLTDSTKQTIQIMAHGVSGSTKVCVKSNRAGDQENCQSGVSHCAQNAIGGSNEIKYVFYCRGCEADVSIWLRFNVSYLITDDQVFESWCNNANSQFPNSLIQVPGEPHKPIITKDKNTASALTATPYFLLLGFLAWYIDWNQLKPSHK